MCRLLSNIQTTGEVGRAESGRGDRLVRGRCREAALDQEALRRSEE